MITRKIVHFILFMQSKPSITRHKFKTGIVVTDKQINKKKVFFENKFHRKSTIVGVVFQREKKEITEDHKANNSFSLYLGEYTYFMARAKPNKTSTKETNK